VKLFIGYFLVEMQYVPRQMQLRFLTLSEYFLRFLRDLFINKVIGRFNNLIPLFVGSTGGHSIAPKTTSANAASASP